MPIQYKVVRFFRGAKRDELVCGYNREDMAIADCNKRNTENRDERYIYIIRPETN